MLFPVRGLAVLLVTGSAGGQIPGTRISTQADPAWTALFHRRQGWTGGDGIFAIPLSGKEGPGRTDTGKTLFVFSDTFVG
jgi:hypothetical protein